MADRAPDNLLADLQTARSEELVTILAQNQHVRVERIVSTGQATSQGCWYDQEEHEWVVVLKGESKLVFEDGESVQMATGDHILILAHRKHRVEWTTPEEPTVWLAVFYQVEAGREIGE